MSNESNAVALYSRLQSASDIMSLGIALGKSGAFGLTQSEGGIVILMTCACEGISPVQYARKYDTVNGKPRKKAMAAYAEFRKLGGKVTWLNTGQDCQKAEARFEFEGTTLNYSYTIDEARKAGLIKPKGAWETSAPEMLRSKVLGKAIAMLAPEIYAGDDDDGDAPSVALNLGPAPTAAPIAPAIDISSSVSTQTVGSVPAVPVKPAKVAQPAPAIEVVIQTEPAADGPALAAAGLAPVIQPKPAPVAAPRPVESTPGALASVEQLARLQELIGEEHYEKAVAWFVKGKWLNPGESFMRLRAVILERIFRNQTSWLVAIGAIEKPVAPVKPEGAAK